MARRQKRENEQQDPPIRPQLYLSVMLVMVIIVLVFTGQWDWALAIFIGLLVGNMLSTFRKP
jgi:uncharacterized membrane protein YdbT with pleckstrin-like domain